MENPIKMDDLGVPLFLETPKWPKKVVERFLFLFLEVPLPWCTNALGEGSKVCRNVATLLCLKVEVLPEAFTTNLTKSMLLLREVPK